MGDGRVVVDPPTRGGVTRDRAKLVPRRITLPRRSAGERFHAAVEVRPGRRWIAPCIDKFHNYQIGQPLAPIGLGNRSEIGHVEVLQTLGPQPVRVARRHHPGEGLPRWRAHDLGLSSDVAASVWDRFAESPDSYGGVLPVSDGATCELVLVKPGAVDCLRRAVKTRLGGGYNFEQVLDWLDEAVRVEPGLMRHYRPIVKMIRSAISFDDVCIVAA